MLLIFILFLCVFLKENIALPNHSLCSFAFSTSIRSIYSEWCACANAELSTVNPCSWRGVQCMPGTNVVSGLNIVNQNLTGE